MKAAIKTLAGLAIIALALTGCTNQPDHSLIGEEVRTSFDPKVDGFAFPNFNADRYAQAFDVQDLTSMAGISDKICLDVDAAECELTEDAQKILNLVNNSRQLGHCEGMVVLAAARFDVGTKVKTIALEDDAEVINAIIKGFATMFFPEVQSQSRDWVSYSLKDSVAMLAKSLKTGKLEYGMGLYTTQGGHEVLPYAIEYPSENLAKVWVYDPNWPGEERYVEINLSDDTWRFSFEAADQTNDPYAWTGMHKDFELNSNKVRLAAIQSRTGDVDLPDGPLWDTK